MAVLGPLIAALLFPGLATALLAGALFGLIVHGRVALPKAAGALTSREGLATIAGVILSSIGLALIPWPLHPAASGAAWLWAWSAFELAFLIPLLPALLTGAPALTRAAIREAQLGALARAALWAALGVAVSLHNRWEGVALAAHILALGAACAAYPAAIGWGPFGPEELVSPGGIWAGLPEPARALGQWTADMRAAALLVAALVASLPTGVLPGPLSLALTATGLALAAALLRRFEGRAPRMNLPAALRFCLLLPMPLAAAATIALVAT